MFNIAQCYRSLGDPASAGSFYRAYRREAPDASNRADVDRLIEEMDKNAAAQHAPPQATVAPASPPPLVTAPSSTSNVVEKRPERAKPITRKPWFWATIGAGAAVVIAGVTLAVVLGTSSNPPTPTVGHVNGN